MSKILFITEKVSFISEGIVNHLKAQNFEVITVKPDVTAISNYLKAKESTAEGEPIDPEVAALLSQEGMDASSAEPSGGSTTEEDFPRILILYLQNEENLMVEVLG